MDSYIPFLVKVAKSSVEGVSVFRYAFKYKVIQRFTNLTKGTWKMKSRPG